MPDLGPPLQKYMQICLVSLALYRGLRVSVPPEAMAQQEQWVQSLQDLQFYGGL